MSRPNGYQNIREPSLLVHTHMRYTSPFRVVPRGWWLCRVNSHSPTTKKGHVMPSNQDPIITLLLRKALLSVKRLIEVTYFWQQHLGYAKSRKRETRIFWSTISTTRRIFWPAISTTQSEVHELNFIRRSSTPHMTNSTFANSTFARDNKVSNPS